MTDPAPHRRLVRWLFLVAGSALVAACSSGTKVDSTWTEGVARDAGFGKVLIIGVTPDYNTRCRFERMLMNTLNGREVRAVTSCSAMSSKDPLTRDAVVAVVGKVGADAVLSTRLVDGHANMTEGGTDEARGEAYYKPIGYTYDSYYGAFGVPVTYVDFTSEKAQFTLTRTVVVSSNLYRAADAQMIYSLDTTTSGRTSQGDVIESVATAISERLQRDGLVRK